MVSALWLSLMQLFDCRIFVHELAGLYLVWRLPPVWFVSLPLVRFVSSRVFLVDVLLNVLPCMYEIFYLRVRCRQSSE